MATQTMPIADFQGSGVAVSLEYDDVTLLVSAVLATNPSGVSASLTVLRDGVPTKQALVQSDTPLRYAAPGSFLLATTLDKFGRAVLGPAPIWGWIVAVPG